MTNLREKYETDLRLFYFSPFDKDCRRHILLHGISLEITTNIFADDYEDMAIASHADYYFDIGITYTEYQKKTSVLLLYGKTMRGIGVSTMNPYVVLTSAVVQQAIEKNLPADIVSKINVYKTCYRKYSLEEYVTYIKNQQIPQGLVHQCCYEFDSFTIISEYRTHLSDSEDPILDCWSVMYNNLYQRIGGSYSECYINEVADVDDLENLCWQELLENLKKNFNHQYFKLLESSVRSRNIDKILSEV